MSISRAGQLKTRYGKMKALQNFRSLKLAPESHQVDQRALTVLASEPFWRKKGDTHDSAVQICPSNNPFALQVENVGVESHGSLPRLPGAMPMHSVGRTPPATASEAAVIGDRIRLHSAAKTGVPVNSTHP